MDISTSLPSSPRQLINPLPNSVKNQIFKSLHIEEQPVVALGRRQLDPMPPLPEPQNQPYQLLKRRGNIAKCNGCGKLFDKDREVYVFGRPEFEWYQKVDAINHVKFYKVGGIKNRYYCLLKSCILRRRPNFTNSSMAVTSIDEASATVKDQLQTEFSVTITSK